MTIPGTVDTILASDRGEAPHPVVMEVRGRILRNLQEPFPHRLEDEEREILRARLFEQVDDIKASEGCVKLHVEELKPSERRALTELGILDPLPDDHEELRGLVLMSDPRTSVLVGARDHLCIQARRGGWAIDDSYAELDCIDAALEERTNFAFSEAFGYLTASPRRAGTGLDVRIQLHLPALALQGEMPRLLRGLAALHVEPVLSGEGEDPGSILSITNARSLGRSEREILSGLSEVVTKLEEFEEKAREALLSEARSLLEDRVWTAFGQLRYGRMVSGEEADTLLGTLRLGCLAGIMQTVDIAEVQDHWLRVSDGGLQLETGRNLPETELSALRADRLRAWLDGDATE